MSERDDGDSCVLTLGCCGCCGVGAGGGGANIVGITGRRLEDRGLKIEDKR